MTPPHAPRAGPRTRPWSRRAFLGGSAGALGWLALPSTARGLLRTIEPLETVAEPLDYVAVGTALLERFRMGTAPDGANGFEELVRRACVNLALGPVVLNIPLIGFADHDTRDAGYPAAIDSLRDAVPAVLRALMQAGTWSGVADLPEFKDRDFEAAAEMLELPADLLTTLPETPLPLRALLGDRPGRRERALLDALELLDASGACAPAAASGDPGSAYIPLLILPTRREMVEFACAAGVLEPSLAGVFHHPSITGWVHAYFGGDAAGLGRMQVLCLAEGQVGDGALSVWDQASQATAPDFVRQSLTYDVLVAWANARGSMVPNWLALGLGFEGVRACYGGVYGRVGADSVGDVTPPRSAFIPGGNSDGGMFLPNFSELRAVLRTKDFERFLEDRKQAAYTLLDARERNDPQRKAARSGDEVVYFNLRDAAGSEERGYLHYGRYIGTDVRHLVGRGVGADLARTQRAVFLMVCGALAARDKGKALARLLAALPTAEADFAALFQAQVGVSPGAIEREVFAEIDRS